MYKCLHCDAEFDTPTTKREYMGECHGSPYYESVSVCSECQSENFEALDVCDICGVRLCSEDTKYMLIINGEVFCKNCIDEALKQEFQNLDFEEKLEVLGFEVI